MDKPDGMEITMNIEETEQIGPNRRSSILKPPKQRNPLTDLDFTAPIVNEGTPLAKLRRRVSFASNNLVKQFATDNDKNTIWDSTYEEAVNKSDQSTEKSITPHDIHNSTITGTNEQFNLNDNDSTLTDNLESCSMEITGLIDGEININTTILCDIEKNESANRLKNDHSKNVILNKSVSKMSAIGDKCFGEFSVDKENIAHFQNVSNRYGSENEAVEDMLMTQAIPNQIIKCIKDCTQGKAIEFQSKQAEEMMMTEGIPSEIVSNIAIDNERGSNVRNKTNTKSTNVKNRGVQGVSSQKNESGSQIRAPMANLQIKESPNTVITHGIPSYHLSSIEHNRLQQNSIDGSERRKSEDMIMTQAIPNKILKSVANNMDKLQCSAIKTTEQTPEDMVMTQAIPNEILKSVALHGELQRSLFEAKNEEPEDMVMTRAIPNEILKAIAFNHELEHLTLEKDEPEDVVMTRAIPSEILTGIAFNSKLQMSIVERKDEPPPEDMIFTQAIPNEILKRITCAGNDENMITTREIPDRILRSAAFGSKFQRSTLETNEGDEPEDVVMTRAIPSEILMGIASNRKLQTSIVERKYEPPEDMNLTRAISREILESNLIETNDENVITAREPIVPLEDEDLVMTRAISSEILKGIEFNNKLQSSKYKRSEDMILTRSIVVETNVEDTITTQEISNEILRTFNGKFQRFVGEMKCEESKERKSQEIPKRLLSNAEFNNKSQCSVLTLKDEEPKIVVTSQTIKDSRSLQYISYEMQNRSLKGTKIMDQSLPDRFSKSVEGNVQNVKELRNKVPDEMMASGNISKEVSVNTNNLTRVITNQSVRYSLNTDDAQQNTSITAGYRQVESVVGNTSKSNEDKRKNPTPVQTAQTLNMQDSVTDAMQTNNLSPSSSFYVNPSPAYSPMCVDDTQHLINYQINQKHPMSEFSRIADNTRASTDLSQLDFSNNVLNIDGEGNVSRKWNKHPCSGTPLKSVAKRICYDVPESDEVKVVDAAEDDVIMDVDTIPADNRTGTEAKEEIVDICSSKGEENSEKLETCTNLTTGNNENVAVLQNETVCKPMSVVNFEMETTVTAPCTNFPQVHSTNENDGNNGNVQNIAIINPINEGNASINNAIATDRDNSVLYIEDTSLPDYDSVNLTNNVLEISDTSPEDLTIFDYNYEEEDLCVPPIVCFTDYFNEVKDVFNRAVAKNISRVKAYEANVEAYCKEVNEIIRETDEILSMNEASTDNCSEASFLQTSVYSPGEARRGSITFNTNFQPLNRRDAELSLKDRILIQQKRNMNTWNAISLEGLVYKFETLHRKIILIVTLADIYSGLVENLATESQMPENPNERLLFAYHKFMKHLNSNVISRRCGKTYNIETLLDYIEICVQDVETTIAALEDFDLEYCMKMDRNFSASFVMINFKLLFAWRITIDLTDEESISPNEVSCVVLEGTVKENEIKLLVNDCPKGSNFLRCFISKLNNYIQGLENRRRL